jgi:hypothetical protein
MPLAIPIATYRLQLSADFDFDAAASTTSYLRALGITHLYASPFTKARKGSLGTDRLGFRSSCCRLPGLALSKASIDGRLIHLRTQCRKKERTDRDSG